jgi:hypothetical protein
MSATDTPLAPGQDNGEHPAGSMTVVTGPDGTAPMPVPPPFPLGVGLGVGLPFGGMVPDGMVAGGIIPFGGVAIGGTTPATAQHGVSGGGVSTTAFVQLL